jgi:hypothetical protein
MAYYETNEEILGNKKSSFILSRMMVGYIVLQASKKVCSGAGQSETTA